MDPKTATNERVTRDRKPDHTLISFFGDDSYGWFPKGRDIISFASNYVSKAKQAAAKKVSEDVARLRDAEALMHIASSIRLCKATVIFTNNAMLSSFGNSAYRHICLMLAC